MNLWNRHHKGIGWQRKVAEVLCALATALALSACATIAPTGPINDPLEPANRAISKFNDGVGNVLKPVAIGYKKITPPLLRAGVNNFFGNLGDVPTAANGFLQGKIKQGSSDTARVAVNTVLGLGGVIDVASTLDLEKHNEDFGQTLGVWGVPEGPYIVLPIWGPQTLRGAVGLLGDGGIFKPVNTIKMSFKVRGSLWTLNAINKRANLLAATSIIDAGALDPYQFVKDRYIVYRRSQVYDWPTVRSKSKAPSGELDDLDELDELDDLDMLDELDELDDLDEP